MNILLYLIVCAIVVGSHAKNEPVYDFGNCDPQFSNVKGSSILEFFNDPANADLRELLRNTRDITVLNMKIKVNNEDSIRNFTENLFGKNEVADRISEMIITKRENNIKMGLCFINNILRDNKTHEAFDLEEAVEDFQETVEKLRVRVKNLNFEDKKFQVYIEVIQVYIEQLFGKSEVTDQLRELIRITLELSKQILLNLMNSIVGDKKTNWSFFSQRSDVNKLVRKLRDIIQSYHFDEEKTRDIFKTHLELDSERTYLLTSLVKVAEEMLRQRLINFLNRILGDKETHGAFYQNVDFNELVKMREFMQSLAFDEGHFFRDSLEKLYGKSEMTESYYVLMKAMRERGKRRLLNFVNQILQDKETQETYSVQHADSNASRLKNRLEKLISRMKDNLDNGEGVGENRLLIKKAKAAYVKLLSLGLDLNDEFKRMFQELRKLDRLSSPKTIRR